MTSTKTAAKFNLTSIPLIPRDVLFGNPEKASPELSLDGKYLAYLAPDQNNVLNVFVSECGSSESRMVTADQERGIRSYMWRPDSKHIIYIQDQKGDENWRIYQTNIESMQTTELTPFDNVTAWIVDVDRNHPDEILIALNKRTPHCHDVYRLDLNSGSLMLEYENPGDVMGWWADNDFQIRAKLRMLPDGGSQIWVKDSMQSDWRKALEFSADESGHSAQGFTADNKGLYVVSSVDSNAARLIEYRLEDGSQKVIAEDKQFDVSGILTNPINHELEAVYFTKERQYWHIVSKSIEADFAYLKTVCDGDFSLLSRSHDDNLWVVIYWMDNGPSRHYIYDRKAKKAEFLFTSKPSLEKFTMSKMQPISFIARDGMKIYGYLSLPAGYESQLSSDTAMAMTDEEKLPAVMLVHGGPWHRDSWGLHPEVQWLTNRGYAVLQINFRGSTGYGKDYLNAGDREWGAKMHDDLLDGKQWLIKQGYVHPKKIAIYGGSYGGYATLVGLAFTPDEFNCGVDIVGPSSIVTLINSIPPYWAPMKCIFDKRVGRVEEEREFLESRSPLHKADAIKAPLLIAQGANDPRVKQAESDQIVEAMRKNGKEVEYMLFEDEGHGFAKPENRMKFYAVAEKFLAKHLGGRSES